MFSALSGCGSAAGVSFDPEAEGGEPHGGGHGGILLSLLHPTLPWPCT